MSVGGLACALQDISQPPRLLLPTRCQNSPLPQLQVITIRNLSRPWQRCPGKQKHPHCSHVTLTVTLKARLTVLPTLQVTQQASGGDVMYPGSQKIWRRGLAHEEARNSRTGGGGQLHPCTQREKTGVMPVKPSPNFRPALEAASQQNRILSGMEGLAADCVLLIMFK